jgi:hypothetical protein
MCVLRRVSTRGAREKMLSDPTKALKVEEDILRSKRKGNLFTIVKINVISFLTISII